MLLITNQASLLQIFSEFMHYSKASTIGPDDIFQVHRYVWKKYDLWTTSRTRISLDIAEKVTIIEIPLLCLSFSVIVLNISKYVYHAVEQWIQLISTIVLAIEQWIQTISTIVLALEQWIQLISTIVLAVEQWIQLISTIVLAVEQWIQTISTIVFAVEQWIRPISTIVLS